MKLSGVHSGRGCGWRPVLSCPSGERGMGPPPALRLPPPVLKIPPLLGVVAPLLQRAKRHLIIQDARRPGGFGSDRTLVEVDHLDPWEVCEAHEFRKDEHRNVSIPGLGVLDCEWDALAVSEGGGLSGLEGVEGPSELARAAGA